MCKPLEFREEVTQVTCVVHQHSDKKVMECLRDSGFKMALLENARCVRRSMKSRRWILPGTRTELANAPMEIFRMTVARPDAPILVGRLVETLGLHTPGHGAIYAKDMKEYSNRPLPEISGSREADDSLRDFTVITAILSLPGSAQELAGLALRLGVAVPVISLGMGTGIRDRLGLLRITIPPEKELARIMVPTHDAATIQRILIEEGRLDRPGGGFLYQTPVRLGVADSLVSTGKQAHAATMEQLIAAMDTLQKGTEWRKRYGGGVVAGKRQVSHPEEHSEIGFVCSEGRSQRMLRSAMRAGAQGATISRVRHLSFNATESGIAARERGILCVPRKIEEDVVQALQKSLAEHPDPACCIRVTPASSVFSHMHR